MGKGLDSAIEQFSRYLLSERNASRETVRAYLREVTELRQFLSETGKGFSPHDGPGSWASVSVADVRCFLAARYPGKKGSTMARKIAAIRAFFSFLVTVGKILAAFFPFS